MAEVSERVAQVLEDYFDMGDFTGLDALAEDVRKPALAWFPDEFAQLLAAGGPSPQWWGRVLFRDGWTDAQAGQLDRDLRAIWNAVAPGKPFPRPAASD